MHRTFRKSDLQTLFQESLAQYPPTQRARITQEDDSLRNESSNDLPSLDSQLPKAAVALIISDFGASDAQFLLTERSSQLKHHPGQIALPGGLLEADEIKNPLEGLDREIFEEVGLPVGCIEWVVNPWDSAISLHDLCVLPFLGFLKNAESLTKMRVDPTEVAQYAWLPLSQLFDESQWEWRDYERRSSETGSPVRYTMPVWKGWKSETWGLTAYLLWAFVRRISGRPPY